MKSADQKSARSPSSLGSGPLLWEAICFTVLTRPAEQGVVAQIIGESLIHDSAFLHREALALRAVLSLATFQKEADRRSSESHHRAHQSRTVLNGEGCESQFANKSKKDDASRAKRVDVNKTKKHDSVAIKTRKDAVNRARKADNWDSHPPQTLSETLEISCAGNICDDPISSLNPFDFSEFLQEKGEKINAYDIDEVVEELREVFAAEQECLNCIVEELRSELDKCMDSYSGVKTRRGIEQSKDIKKQSKDPNPIKESIPRIIKTPTQQELTGQVASKYRLHQASSDKASLGLTKSTTRLETTLSRLPNVKSNLVAKSEKLPSSPGHVLAIKSMNHPVKNKGKH